MRERRTITDTNGLSLAEPGSHYMSTTRIVAACRRLLHLVEVCTFSRPDKSRIRIPIITTGPSLFPPSSTRSTNSFPCGSPAISQSSGAWRRIGLTVFHASDTGSLGPACMPAIILSMYSQARREYPIARLLAQASQHLWLVTDNDTSNGSSIPLTLLPNLAPPPPGCLQRTTFSRESVAALTGRLRCPGGFTQGRCRPCMHP